MVKRCVLGCRNAFGRGYRIFRFPSDPKRRKLWAEKCHGKDWVPPTNAVICEIHFSYDQYENGRADGWRKLKPNAIPNLNFDVDASQQKKSSDESKSTISEILRENIYVSGDLFSENQLDITDLESEEQISAEISVVHNSNITKSKNDSNQNKIHIIKVSKCDSKNKDLTKKNAPIDASKSTSDDRIPKLNVSPSAVRKVIDSSNKRRIQGDFPILKAMEIENIILPEEISSEVKNFDVSGISIIPVTNVEKLNKPSTSGCTSRDDSNDVESSDEASNLEWTDQFYKEFREDNANQNALILEHPESEDIPDNSVNDTCSSEWWGKCSGHEKLENQMKKLKTELQRVTSILNKFLTSDQITVLLNPRPAQLKWNRSPRRSIYLGRRFMDNLGLDGYRFLRSTNYPLPPESMIMEASPERGIVE